MGESTVPGTPVSRTEIRDAATSTGTVVPMGKRYTVFSDNFKRLHLRSGKTHRQIAEEVGVSTQAVESWSKGVRRASGPNLAALCRVLRCTPDDLMKPSHNGRSRRKTRPPKHA